MSYSSKNRHKYYLKCHLIFVCKYRKKLLVGEFNDFIKQTCCIISLKSDFAIDIMESDKDHMHFLISYPPSVSVTSIVRKLKQETTIAVWKKYKRLLSLHFWKEHTFWSDGYFVCSIGEAKSRNNLEIYREPRIGCSSCANSSHQLKTNGFSWHVFINLWQIIDFRGNGFYPISSIKPIL